MKETSQPILSHLGELRRCLIVSIVTWIVGFSVCYSQAEWLFTLISGPVRKTLPEGSSLVFIHATEPFLTYLKLGAIAGLIVAMPIILWQLWMFISPALYQGEKKVALPFVLSSCLCFGCGAYLGFTEVFPLIFIFLITYGTGISDVSAMLSISGYLTMASRLLMAFGLVFELPIVIFFLVKLQVVDYRWLAKNRKYALLFGFIVGAILTPPDIFSQVAIALPFVVLYEVGIVVARLLGNKTG